MPEPSSMALSSSWMDRLNGVLAHDAMLVPLPLDHLWRDGRIC